MTIPRPQDRPISTHTTADAALETFTIGLPRWPILRLFSRNPLIRASDRVEALALALAIVISLLAAPVAAAVGTAVYDSRRDVYAEQARTRHSITATITEDVAVQENSRTNTVTIGARWSAAGAQHTGDIKVQSAAKSGDHVPIWVDNSGALTDEPTPTSRAAVNAVAVALFMWAGIMTAAAILLAGTRAVCDRLRARRWQDNIDTLVGRDGHTTS